MKRRLFKKIGAGDQIKNVIKRLGRCEIETLCAECAELTWNQVFLELDRMSRMGEVVLSRRGPESYLVNLPIDRGDAPLNERCSPEQTPPAKD